MRYERPKSPSAKENAARDRLYGNPQASCATCVHYSGRDGHCWWWNGKPPVSFIDHGCDDYQQMPAFSVGCSCCEHWWPEQQMCGLCEETPPPDVQKRGCPEFKDVIPF